MTPLLLHPLVLTLFVASVATTALFARSTLSLALDWRTHRSTRTLRYLWFAVWSAVNPLFVVLTLVDTAPIIKVQIFQGVWVSGILTVSAWAGAVQAYLRRVDPVLDAVRITLAALALVPAVDFVGTFLTGRSLMFSLESRPTDWVILLASGNVHSHRPFADAIAVGLGIGTVAIAFLLLRAIRRSASRDDVVLLFAVVTTLVLAAAELVLGGSGYAMPLIFMANHLEAVRMTWASTHEVATELERLRQARRAQHDEIERQLERMAQAEQLAAVGRQTARITHDLRNPVSALLLGVSELEEICTEPEARETLDDMALAARHLRDLATRITRQAREPLTTRFTLRSVVDDALHLTRHLQAHLACTVDVASDLILEGHRSELVQVLVNLIANAAQAVEDRPERWIHIEATDDLDHLEFRVRDAGRRPADDVRARMFRERFTTRQGGTGLGLDISRRVVVAHGGTIQVDPEDAHTTIVVRLPKTCASGAAAPRRVSLPPHAA